MKRNPLRILWLLLGLLCLALGTVGVVLPILPSVPFYLATVFCFAKSSEKLHSWFLGTALYKKNLESFVERRAMTMKTKLTIVGHGNPGHGGRVPPYACRAGGGGSAWRWYGSCHLLYFFARVKTLKPGESVRTEEKGGGQR